MAFQTEKYAKLYYLTEVSLLPGGPLTEVDEQQAMCPKNLPIPSFDPIKLPMLNQ